MPLVSLLIVFVAARPVGAANTSPNVAATQGKLSVLPTSLSYSINLDNGTSQVKYFTLTNKGTQALNVTIDAPTQPDYVISSPALVSPAGGSISIPGEMNHSAANEVEIAITFVPPGPGKNLTATIPISVDGLSGKPSAIIKLNGSAAQTPQGLWVAGYQEIYEFEGAALQTSGESDENLAFDSKVYGDSVSMAFDPSNNLWVFYGQSEGGPPPIVEISRTEFASLRKSRQMKPTVVIEGKETAEDPYALGPCIAFDSVGNLWGCDPFRSAILEFQPGQIKRSGAPIPVTVLESDNFTPQAMRFDHANNLWVEQFPQPYDPSNALQMWKFAPSERGQSGSANPGLVLILPDAIEPVDFAFDRVGNLWVAGDSSKGDAIEMFPADQLSGMGQISPSAAVTITSPAFGTVFDESGSCLGGLDFDYYGNLWVSVGTNNTECQALTQLAAFTPAQLTSGGSLMPSLAIYQNLSKSNLTYPGPIRFGPTS